MTDLQRKTANLSSLNEVNDTITNSYFKNNKLTIIPVTAGTYTISFYLAEKTSGILNGSIGIGTLTDYTYDINNYQTPDNTPYTITRTFTITQSQIDTYGGYIWARFLRHGSRTDFSYKVTQIMLNTGSTALPYEPYGWVHSLRKLGTETETIQSGDTIYADGTAISTYSINGNTVQNGTPTPSNPVSVNGVGDMSSNLLDSGSTTYTVLNVTITANNGYYTLNGQSSNGGGRTYHVSKDIMLDSGTYVMKLIGTAEGVTPYIQNGSTIIGYNGYAFTLNEPTSIYLGFNFDNSKPYFDNVSFGVMLIQSSTAPTTFEPYGYKIPISTSQGTTNIYTAEPLMKISDSVDSISNTEEIRAIKKYVITGDEIGWSQDGSSGSNNRYRLYISNVKNTGTYITDFYNSHYKVETGYAANTSVIWRGTSSTYVYISVPSSDYPTVSDYKTYLQQQYTNGTPVTVWYQLATPTTEQITLPTIPTTDGANTITVDTTVQPSEFSATWTGWHDASVKEWDGSQWQ